MKKFRRLMAGLLAIALVVGLMPNMPASKVDAAGTIKVIIENYAYLEPGMSEATKDTDFTWTGTKLEADMPLNDNSTLEQVLKAACEANNIKFEAPQTEYGAYIQAVDGLSNSGYDGEGKAGTKETGYWSFTINGWAADMGASGCTVENGRIEAGDTVVLYYSTDGGYSRYGITYGNWPEPNPKQYLESLSIDGITLTPAFNKDIKEYNISTSATSIVVNAKVANNAYLTKINGKKYQGPTTISLADTDEIKVSVGGFTPADTDVVYTIKVNANKKIKPEDLYKGSVNVITPSAPDLSYTWNMLALQRGSATVSDSIKDKYFQSIAAKVTSNKGLVGNSATDSAKAIIGLTALGYDATNVAGYNIFDGLSNYSKITGQGVNAAMYALIALNTNTDYKLPSDGTTTEAKLIDFVLDYQMNDGGFALMKTGAYAGSDVDMTAIAIQSLSAYYGTDSAITSAIDKAVSYLKANQKSYGGYGSCESDAQAIVALCAILKDPDSAEFTKDGYSIIDGIKVYADKKAGFCHELGGGYNALATQQAMYALAAHYRFSNRMTALYDMNDVTLNVGKYNPVKYTIIRMYNPKNGDHFYTSSVKEAANAAASGVYVPESMSYFKTNGTGNKVYRAYNPVNGDHFYTASKAEWENASKHGYVPEGVAFTSSSTGRPVYRLYNGANSDHFYTTSVAEKNSAINNSKYIDEGIAFYVN